jgi:hypothetical protein
MYKKLIIEQEEELDWAQAERDAEAARQKSVSKTEKPELQTKKTDKSIPKKQDQTKPIKKKTSITNVDYLNRTDMITHAMNFIENAYVIAPTPAGIPKAHPSYPSSEQLYNYMKNDLSGNTAKYIALILNSFANLSKIDKKHLNYIITANGNTSLPPYQFYAADILEKMRYKDIRGAFVYRNLKTLFTSVVNLSIYSDFDENIIPAKKIINLLNSRGIARMMPSNTNDIYTYTPLYKLYPNPAAELKRLYDSNYFGTPKK